MTGDPELLPVNTKLVLETLVTRLSATVAERRGEPLAAAAAALVESTDVAFAPEAERELDLQLRRAGYLSRAAETELFEPARRAPDWIAERVRGHDGANENLSAAIVATCAELARSEPVGKPSPDDELAMSWRVPGPGGHVRHFLARATIEEDLGDREDAIEGDPAELKRPWLYGFYVHTCEEALGDAAAL